MAGSDDNRNYSLLFSVKRETHITQNDADAYNKQSAKALAAANTNFKVGVVLISALLTLGGMPEASEVVSKLPMLKSYDSKMHNAIAKVVTGIPGALITSEIEGSNPIVAGTYNVYVAVYGIHTAEGDKYFVGKYIDAPADGTSGWTYFPFEADSFFREMAWDMAVVF